MPITGLTLKHITAFQQLQLAFSPGLNVFIGANGAGKTHLLKIVYAACDITKTKRSFAEKLVRVFMPSGDRLGRLVRRQNKSLRGEIVIEREGCTLQLSFSNHTRDPAAAQLTGAAAWQAQPIESVYIPVKEMLANAPGFRSLYAQREIHFEEVYADVLDRAYRPVLRGPIDRERKQILRVLQQMIEGSVIIENEAFFLRNRHGNLEFSLLAEGMRKLALIWLLVQNGTLLQGSVLCWDEPEANLNPRLFKPLIEILLLLQRNGVQIFLATHDYLILKEIDLQRSASDQILFHSLYRDGDQIACASTPDYAAIHPNAIADTFADVYDREIKRSLASLHP